MELSDYFRILKRRFWTLALVPMLALAGVIAYVATQPTKFTATATVAAPALVGGINANQYSGANGPKAFVANFTAAATSRPIIDQVSAQTHVKKAAIKQGLSTGQIGTSSLINVTYETARRRDAAPVAKADADATIVFLFKSQLTLAEQPVTEANATADKAQAALTAFTSKIGDPTPDKTYDILIQEVSHLSETKALQTGMGNLTAAARLQDTITAVQAQSAALAPNVATFLTLQHAVDDAQTNVQQLQIGLQQARTQYSAANPEQVVTVGETVKVSPLTTGIKAGAVALGAGIFLAIGLIVCLELMARARRPEDAAPTGEARVDPAVPTPSPGGDHFAGTTPPDDSPETTPANPEPVGATAPVAGPDEVVGTTAGAPSTGAKSVGAAPNGGGAAPDGATRPAEAGLSSAEMARTGTQAP